MSLKSKIEAVIYASEEPVTLPQLVGLLGDEAEAELDALAALQASLPLDTVVEDGETHTTQTLETAPETTTAAGSAAVQQDIGDPVPATEQEQQHDQAAAFARGEQVAIGDAAAAPQAESANTAETPLDPRHARERERRVRDHLRRTVDTLMRDYADFDRGVEIREVAGGFRMGTKPEYHDAVRGFVKSLKPALKLTLQALETLAVVAYKQPVTAAEISEIRGVDSAGVLGGLMARKLIATAGRKQVIGRPMLYKTTKEFLVRFGLKDVQELPSMEEFERLAGELNEQEDLPMEPTGVLIERANARGDADHIREVTGDVAVDSEPSASAPPDLTQSAAAAPDDPTEDAKQHLAEVRETPDTAQPTRNDPQGAQSTPAELQTEADPSASTHPTTSNTEPEA